MSDFGSVLVAVCRVLKAAALKAAAAKATADKAAAELLIEAEWSARGGDDSGDEADPVHDDECECNWVDPSAPCICSHEED